LIDFLTTARTRLLSGRMLVGRALTLSVGRGVASLLSAGWVIIVARGLTLDQFGLSAGDELVVGRQRQVFNPAASAVLGTIASLSAIFFAVHH